MATYDLTSAVPSKIATGDILNCPYSGNYVSVTLPKGQFKLECWGAGARRPSSSNGKGGYASGVLNLTEKTTLYLYAGGKDTNPVYVNSEYWCKGGWNGGGASRQNSSSGGDSGGGGGASDICLVASEVTEDASHRFVRSDASYKSRILVAGGAGGGYSTSYTAQRAGGYCPSQTTSQTSYIGSMTAAGSISNSSYMIRGGFGYAATSTYNGDDYGGGGGGWYGGGSQGDVYGGGGSSFAWCATYASYVPTGYSVDTSLYLTDVSLIYGNATMTDPDSGSSTTGRSGDGYIRITVVYVNNGLEIYTKENGSWKKGVLRIKENGVWNQELKSLPDNFKLFKFPIPTINQSCTYNGLVQAPIINQYYSQYQSLSGDSSAINAGTYNLIVSLSDESYKWINNTKIQKNISWTINKNPNGFELSSNLTTITPFTESTIMINNLSGGNISITNSNPNCCTATLNNDQISLSYIGDGQSTITVTCAETTNYLQTIKSINVLAISITDFILDQFNLSNTALSLDYKVKG